MTLQANQDVPSAAFDLSVVETNPDNIVDKRATLSFAPGLYLSGAGMTEEEFADAVVAFAKSLGYIPAPEVESERYAWYDERMEAIMWLNKAPGRPDVLCFSAGFGGLWLSSKKHCINQKVISREIGESTITWALMTYPLLFENFRYLDFK